jgi:hypothetical protein
MHTLIVHVLKIAKIVFVNHVTRRQTEKAVVAGVEQSCNNEKKQ